MCTYIFNIGSLLSCNVVMLIDFILYFQNFTLNRDYKVNMFEAKPGWFIINLYTFSGYIKMYLERASDCQSAVSTGRVKWNSLSYYFFSKKHGRYSQVCITQRHSFTQYFFSMNVNFFKLPSTDSLGDTPETRSSVQVSSLTSETSIFFVFLLCAQKSDF